RAEQAIAGYDFAEGRRRLDRCLSLQPNDLELHLSAARAARRDGDLDAAQRHLSAYRAIAQHYTPQAALEWQLISAQQGHVRDVVNELMEAIDIHHPQTEQILEALALGCVQNYEFNQAMFWIQELLERSPKNAIGRLLQAQTIDTLGDRQKTIAILQ